MSSNPTSNVSFSSSIISQSRGRSEKIPSVHHSINQHREQEHQGEDEFGVGDYSNTKYPEWLQQNDDIDISRDFGHFSLLEATSSPARQKSKRVQQQSESVKRSTDVWTRLYQQEKGSRIKYYDTPKNMMLQIEQEREKNAELDAEYKRFSREALRERERLVREIKSIKQRATNDINNIQKALISKQDEYLDQKRELEEMRLKYEDTILNLRNDREKLGLEIGRLKKIVNESENATKEQRVFVSRVLDDKKKLQELLNKSKDELNSLKKNVSDNETGWSKEREVRMQQDIHIRQLEHNLSLREADIQELRAQICRKDAELEEKNKLKAIIDQQKRQLEDSSANEQMLTEKLNQMQIKDKNLQQQIHEIEAQERRNLMEIQKFSQVESSLRIEIENLKTQNTAAVTETREWVEKYHQKSQRIEELSLALDKSVADLHQQQKYLQTVKHEHQLMESRFKAVLEEHHKQDVQSSETIKRLHGDITRLSEENQRMKSIIDKLQSELEYSHAIMNNMDQKLTAHDEQDAAMRLKLREVNADLDDSRQRAHALKNQLEEMTGKNKFLLEQLDVETKEKDHVIDAYENKLKVMHEKIERFKDVVDEYQKKIRMFQEVENNLKKSVSDRQDELINAHDEIRSLSQQLKQVFGERDQFAAHFKTESQAFKDRMQKYRLDFEEKYAAMERQKDEQIRDLQDKLQQFHSNLMAMDEERKRLLKKADNSAYEREISTLRQALERKEEEVKLAQLKYRNAAEHVKRLEIETSRPSTSPYRVENASGITGLTRRLKEEVQQLMEKEKSLETPSSTSFLASINYKQQEQKQDL